MLSGGIAVNITQNIGVASFRWRRHRKPVGFDIFPGTGAVVPQHLLEVNEVLITRGGG
jgi:hypothetical protein